MTDHQWSRPGHLDEAITAGAEALEETMGLGRDEALHYAAAAIEAAAAHLPSPPVDLEALAGEVTSPRMLVGVLGRVPSMAAYGSVTSQVVPDEFTGRDVREVRLTTGGFSDNEDLVARLRRTIFWWTYWESTHRGGMFVFRVPISHWDAEHAGLAKPQGVPW